MSKIATINIGLLGGRKYGKTVFLTKLISLADSSEDGFIQLNAGSESLQIKNQLLLNDGVLPATSIEEVTKYDFLLGSPENITWNMKFCDYAGELVERIDTNTSVNENQPLSVSDSNNLEDTSESNDKSEQSFVANEGNRPYIKKVKKWLKSCDAFIVLVPADITNKDTYPTEEVEIFKQNIGLILKVMKEDEYLMKRPICMAINKWDMLEQSTTLEGILKQKEYASFRNQLKNLCGSNLFVKPISAFGKHLEDDVSKADPEGKPINVIEMLKDLCQKAETSRALVIGKKTRKTPVIIRWFWAPCLLLHNSFQGFSNEKYRKYKKMLWMKYLREFAIGFVSSSISIFVLTLCICTWILYNQYSNIRQQISKGLANKEIVEDTEKQITKKHFFDFMFMKYSLVGIDKRKLLNDFYIAKNKYNVDIFQSCQDYYDERKRDIEDLTLRPKIRTQRADEAISFVQSRIKMLTSDAKERSELQDLVDIRMKNLCQTTSWIEGVGEIGIELYGCYSADEIHLLCENTLKRGVPLGTLYNHDNKLSMVMVTTNKADKEYSPSTLYQDYGINENQFHWQSKNDVRIESKEGQRFIHQKDNGWKFLLFVRDSKKDAFGNSNCYYCLGLMDYDKSEGECPMNITWNMQNKIPGFILEKAQAI